MKIRTDFVTNSSSSSFISYFVRKEEVNKPSAEVYASFVEFINCLIDKFGLTEVQENTYNSNMDYDCVNLDANDKYVCVGEDCGEMSDKALQLEREIIYNSPEYLAELKEGLIWDYISSAYDSYDPFGENKLEDFDFSEDSEDYKEFINEYYGGPDNCLFEYWQTLDEASYVVDYAYEKEDTKMEELITYQVGGKLTDDEKAKLKEYIELLAPFIKVYEFSGGTD